LPLYDIFTSQKTDGSKNELGAANFKALANGDDTVNNDDIARMQKFLTPLDPNAPGSTTLLYGGQPLNRDETLELLVQNGTLTREQADKYKADNATLEEIKIVLKPTPFATMENTNPANPEDPASTLKRVNQAIDKLVEQGQLTQEKANELKAQAAEDPTKVWISLVGIGGNLTTSEKTIEDRIKQACEEANKQAPGLNLNPQDWINNLSSETSLESILSTIKTNAMMYNCMNNPDSTTTAEDPAPTT
jgi:polyhydroxyalkanoate synthesis regulator phasin